MIFTTHIIILTHVVGRGRVRTRASRGSGAVIANRAFCQDPSAKWRLSAPRIGVVQAQVALGCA